MSYRPQKHAKTIAKRTPYTRKRKAPAGVSFAKAKRPMRRARTAGRLMSRLVGEVKGKGMYTFKRNSLAGLDMTKSSVPFVHSSKDGVRIRHREYLQDVSSSTAFTNTTYRVNPGLVSAFPWLSAIAQNFEQYRFEGLVYEFVSTSADALNSTNTALGTVIMAAEYNSASAAYVNKQQMENAMWSQSGKPSSCIVLPVECAPELNPIANQYIRTGAVASGQDIRMYDLANVQIATVGSQATAVVGELWVTYDVVLLKPQLSSGLNLSGKSAHYSLNDWGSSSPLGTSDVVRFDNIGITHNLTTITIPAGNQGNWSLMYRAVGSSTALTTPGLTLTSNATALNILNNNSTWTGSNNSTTSTTFNLYAYFTIVDPSLPTVLTFGIGGVLPVAGALYSDLIINQISGSLN